MKAWSVAGHQMNYAPNVPCRNGLLFAEEHHHEKFRLFMPLALFPSLYLQPSRTYTDPS